jgi:4-hydroxy-tetrahydrodipicolinate synthase
MKPYWQGVFPAITTQMHKDGSPDLAATASHAEVLIKSGISGLVFLGSLGENQSLTAEEKRGVMQAMIEAVAGRDRPASRPAGMSQTARNWARMASC